MRRLRQMLWGAAGLAALACGEATTVGAGADGGSTDASNTPTPDLGGTQDLGGTPDMTPTEIGYLGDPCSSPSDCESGLCTPAPDGSGGRCTRRCVPGEASECPDGWRCEDTLQLGRVCVPRPPGGICALCETDADCVPAGCCHAAACVGTANAPDCTDMMCTQECRYGTLDCGGRCLCHEGRCAARLSEAPNLPE